MKNKFSKIGFLILSLVLIYSCRQEELVSQNRNEIAKSEIDAKFSKLGGKKKKNPYTVENMRKALKKIKEDGKFKKNSATSRMMEDFEIEPSHLYVMYEPETIEQEAELKSDSTLILSDYPLDYDFSQEELDSRPALSEGEIPEYFTAILIDSEEASEQQYVLMDSLYIPEEDPYFLNANEVPSTQTRGTDPNEIVSREDLLQHLLYEAYKLTGNEYELQQAPTENGRWIFGTKWYPSGNLQIYDEVVGRNVPISGAQVLIRQWFTVRQGITNANGNFSTNSVRGEARYIIQWERYNYSIRNGSFFQAETRGPLKKSEAWNYTITGGDDKYHALIHQAAHDYYYGHRFGLISPPMNNHVYSFGRQPQIKIAARETSPWGVPSSYSHIRSDLTFGLFAQVHIKAFGKPSDEVYGTTIHELSHALHSVLDRSSYDNIVRDAFLATDSHVRNRNRRLLETWPTTVEILMTLDRYKTKFDNPYYKVYQGNNYQNYQNRTIVSQNHYTSGGYDMIDDIDQRFHYTDNSYPIDRVNGYTIKQLEQALIGARLWSGWKDNIKSKYDNPTEVYLDELFTNWQD